MRFDAAGFNPNLPQQKTGTNSNINNIEKTTVDKNVSKVNKENITQIDTTNHFDVNLGVTKAPAKELKDVNIFGKATLGVAALGAAAERIDFNKPIEDLAKDILSRARGEQVQNLA